VRVRPGAGDVPARLARRCRPPRGRWELVRGRMACGPMPLVRGRGMPGWGGVVVRHERGRGGRRGARSGCRWRVQRRYRRRRGGRRACLLLVRAIAERRDHRHEQDQHGQSDQQQRGAPAYPLPRRRGPDGASGLPGSFRPAACHACSRHRSSRPARHADPRCAGDPRVRATPRPVARIKRRSCDESAGRPGGSGGGRRGRGGAGFDRRRLGFGRRRLALGFGLGLRRRDLDLSRPVAVRRGLAPQRGQPLQDPGIYVRGRARGAAPATRPRFAHLRRKCRKRRCELPRRSLLDIGATAPALLPSLG
jgi:hypothetical protein